MAGEIETECKSVVRKLPDALQPLERLSRNFWWSWAPDGAEIFRDLDPELWNHCEQNPRALLAGVSDLRLAQMVADSRYVSRVNRLAAARVPSGAVAVAALPRHRRLRA